jgi:hypothetical protein
VLPLLLLLLLLPWRCHDCAYSLTWLLLLLTRQGHMLLAQRAP